MDVRPTIVAAAASSESRLWDVMIGHVAAKGTDSSRAGDLTCIVGAYPGGFVGYLGEPSQVAAGGRPLAVAAEVGREGGEGGAAFSLAGRPAGSVRALPALTLPGRKAPLSRRKKKNNVRQSEAHA
jgi:hypothetical protein